MTLYPITITRIAKAFEGQGARQCFFYWTYFQDHF